MVAAYFGLLGQYSGLVFVGIPGAAVVFIVFHALFIERGLPPTEGRRLELSDGRLRQLDGSDVTAEIDVTRPFEYKNLDRYNVSKALFRLYQGYVQLIFYFSDPGGKETVKSVVQIAWPPPSRHAGRSYPPSAA